ncbi:MAG TPA: PEP-CTERM sorting domain-containing protein [Gemmatimonadaceae bacterium]|nr:PEP-CTERM sorting domain-containing protein [Gemmatimonadaceae bacterium]
MGRRMRRSFAIPLLLGLAAASAQAQDVVIIGNGQACFGLGCLLGETASTTVGGVPIGYSSSAPTDFSGITAGGVLAVNSFGTSTTGNFGVLSLGTAASATPLSTPFTLGVSLVNPITSNILFEGMVTGTVRVLGTGGVLVDFDPATGPANINATGDWQPFHDAITGQSGQLRLTVMGQPIPSGGQAELTGFFEVVTTTTPEPATLALVGTALLGLGGVGLARRRRGVHG